MTVWFASTLFATIDTAIIRNSRPVLFCKNGVVANFAKFTKKHQKEIPLQMFSCEFSEIFHNTFFKEPFGRLLLHKHSALFTSIQGTFAFSKMMSYFLAEYFFGPICRLGTKVGSICKTLSQKPIYNPVKHLAWIFSCGKVNSLTPLGIFAKKSSLVDVQPCSKCASVRNNH